MAYANFLTWAGFKSATSMALPRYFVVRGDGFLASAMGVNAGTTVSNLYTAGNEEDIIVSGLGADTWLVGAVEVQGFGA